MNFILYEHPIFRTSEGMKIGTLEDMKIRTSELAKV
jgi:hypothetical protein